MYLSKEASRENWTDKIIFSEYETQGNKKLFVGTTELLHCSYATH